MEIKEIQDRFDRGYTMAIYGNRERIHEQMTNDIEKLLEAINYKPCCNTSIDDFQIGSEIIYKQLKSAEITDIYDSELQIKDCIGYYKTICKDDVIEKL